MLKRIAFAAALLAILPLGAIGAELKEAPGGKLDGKDPGGLPAGLEQGQVVTGPATITSGDDGTLILRAGAVVEFAGVADDTEILVVRGGTVHGAIGGKTQVVLPTGRMVAPPGGRVDFTARVMDEVRSYFEVRSGVGLVVYEAAASENDVLVYTFGLSAGQSVETWSPRAGDVGFMTGQTNDEPPVALTARVTSRTEIHLSIPRATAGSLVQREDRSRTRISSEAGSWKDGVIGGKVTVDDDPKSDLKLQAGAFVEIDNTTGEVVPPFEETNQFEIIQREISLTSEFTSVATSNFFGLGK